MGFVLRHCLSDGRFWFPLHSFDDPIMRTSARRFAQSLVASILLFEGSVAFVTFAPDQTASSCGSCSLLSASAEPTDPDSAQAKPELIQEPGNVEWGVSYIGGDPCGSKYNNDPFDAASKIQKPGMPDDMKARIEAMAERIRQKEQQKPGNQDS